MGDAAIERERAPRPAWRIILERDRRVALLLLLAVVALSWGLILLGAGMPDMGGMDTDMVMEPAPWSPGYAVLIVFMWWGMMAAMMLPSAAPAILLYDRVVRRAADAGTGATLIFACGYLLVWGAFSLAAAAVHWGLDRSGLLTMGMASASSVLGALLLIGSGIWQLTPLKRACLTRCQSPIQFLAHRWRSGPTGFLRMGMEHGLHCLGCCWMLMALLFYGGVMNLLWIGGIALYVLVEKTTPAGHWVADLAGWALIASGFAVLAVAV
jgi:predicted metal-binding membrane protein